jgi:FkbM family methyltransferase
MERTAEGSICQTARVLITAIQSISTNTFFGKRETSIVQPSKSLYFMKINFFKALIKNSLRRVGLDLRIYRPSSDAFLVKKDLLKKCVQPLTIFDIGANEGQITDRYSQMFPTAKIYSFEPVPEVFTILERKFHENPQIIVNQLAVSDAVGTADFYLHAFTSNVWNSLLPKDPGSNIVPEDVSAVKVPTITIDVFCDRHNIKTIDLLKLDIQGGELLALKGALNMLQKGAIKLIYSEINFCDLYEGQAMFQDIAAYLHDFGYRTYGLYNLYSPNDGALGWGDAIFFRPFQDTSQE